MRLEQEKHFSIELSEYERKVLKYAAKILESMLFPAEGCATEIFYPEFEHDNYLNSRTLIQSLEGIKYILNSKCFEAICSLRDEYDRQRNES